MSGPRGDARAKPAAQRVEEGSLGRRVRAWREQHAWSLVSSLGRFFQRPFATLLTVGVMAVAMALPLALGLALSNLDRLSGSIEASREIGVFLRTDADAAAAERLATSLRQRRDVAGVTIRTPDEGLAEFRELSDLAGALALVDGNPLPYVLRVQPGDGDDAVLARELAAMPAVELVQHDAVWRQRLGAWLAFGRQLAWVMGGLFALGVLLVVGNTVRLEIGARRDEIAVLQQLGATDGFVRRPFIYLGAWYGLAAGVLALALLGLASMLLQPGLASLIGSYGSTFRFRGPDVLSVVVIVFTTTALGWLGAWLASGHHLRQTRPTDL